MSIEKKCSGTGLSELQDRIGELEELNMGKALREEGGISKRHILLIYRLGDILRQWHDNGIPQSPDSAEREEFAGDLFFALHHAQELGILQQAA